MVNAEVNALLYFSALGIDASVCDVDQMVIDSSVGGVLLQYPNTDGLIFDFTGLVKQAHDHKVKWMTMHTRAISIFNPVEVTYCKYSSRWTLQGLIREHWSTVCGVIEENE